MQGSERAGDMANRNRDRPLIDPSSKDHDYVEWPFYHLARLVSIYHLRLDSALKPLGIDVARWRVLSILHREKVATVTRLANEAVIRMSTMTKIVQRMTAEGLVEVRTSEDDARSTEVMISANGQELLEDMKAKVAQIARVAFDGISNKEIEMLNRLSKQIYASLSI